MIDLDVFGEGAEFEHIGLAVASITESAGEEIEIFTDETQRVRVAFVSMHGAPVELIEPLNEKSPVTDSLKKGQKLVHLCFRVPDIETAIKNGRGHGFHLIARPVPATAFEGRRIAWLFSKTYGLVELVER